MRRRSLIVRPTPKLGVGSQVGVDYFRLLAHATAPDYCRGEPLHHDADHAGHGEEGCPSEGADPHRGGGDESRCVFLVPETGGAARPLGPLCADAALSAPPAVISDESPITARFRPPSSFGEPPARLHLIFQVLQM